MASRTAPFLDSTSCGDWVDSYPLVSPGWVSEGIGLCPGCLAQIKQDVEEARQSVWDSLPAMFHLPPWEELRKQRDIDLGFLPPVRAPYSSSGCFYRLLVTVLQLFQGMDLE